MIFLLFLRYYNITFYSEFKTTFFILSSQLHCNRGMRNACNFGAVVSALDFDKVTDEETMGTGLRKIMS